MRPEDLVVRCDSEMERRREGERKGDGPKEESIEMDQGRKTLFEFQSLLLSKGVSAEDRGIHTRASGWDRVVND